MTISYGSVCSGTECTDGLRYKALGNSMATNVMAWIGRRLDVHLTWADRLREAA